MKYCHYCGKQIADEAVICVNCGRTVPTAAANPVLNTQGKKTPAEPDAPSFIYALVGFVLPLVGIILYFVEKESGAPLRARSALRGAITGFVISIVFGILAGILGVVIRIMLKDAMFWATIL